VEDPELFTERYGGYLEEIRARVYRLAIVFVVTFVAGLASTSILLPYFVRLFTIPGATIIATSPFQLLELAMNTGFFCAIALTLPYAFHQVYTFLHDALLPHERRLIVWFVPLSIMLFLIGFSYGFAVMYYAVTVIAQVNVGFGITNLWNITQFISQILITSALLGVLFEFPLVISGLIRLGVITPRFLRRNRRIAYAAIFVFIALLPPTDGISFLVMSVPLLALYELTIAGNSFQKRKELLAPNL
jgi:sec-independent protein translocase protein TatC